MSRTVRTIDDFAKLSFSRQKNADTYNKNRIVHRVKAAVVCISEHSYHSQFDELQDSYDTFEREKTEEEGELMTMMPEVLLSKWP